MKHQASNAPESACKVKVLGALFGTSELAPGTILEHRAGTATDTWVIATQSGPYYVC